MCSEHGARCKWYGKQEAHDMATATTRRREPVWGMSKTCGARAVARKRRREQVKDAVTSKWRKKQGNQVFIEQLAAARDMVWCDMVCYMIWHAILYNDVLHYMIYHGMVYYMMWHAMRDERNIKSGRYRGNEKCMKVKCIKQWIESRWRAVSRSSRKQSKWMEWRWRKQTARVARHGRAWVPSLGGDALKGDWKTLRAIERRVRGEIYGMLYHAIYYGMLYYAICSTMLYYHMLYYAMPCAIKYMM